MTSKGPYQSPEDLIWAALAGVPTMTDADRRYVSRGILATLRVNGYTLTRCVCGEEGRHPRLHPVTCQTYRDWASGRGSS